MASLTRTARFMVRVAFSIAVFTGAPSASADEAPTFADRADETVDASNRSLAFMFNPLAMSAGVFGAEVDIALDRRLAIALEGDVFDLGRRPATALGVGLVIYPLRSVFHGLYLEPRFVFARPVNEAVLDVDWSTDVIGLGGTVGWQWTWDYGFAVRLGAGSMAYLGGPESAAPGGSLTIEGVAVLVMDAALGWTF